MRRLVRVVVTLAWVVLLPSAALAQATIAGVVRDASGAVLPGVVVEASSPALIEKVRSVVTDGTGQYRIIDLRPGTYAISATLPGFSVVRREGIELSGAITATIPLEMRVGGLQETITVTGETPVVDVQSVRRQTTLDNEVLTTVPTARSWAATAVLIPGIVTQAGASADVQVTPQMTVFGGMGGRGNEGRMQVDGLGTGAALNGGGVSTYVADISNAAEVVTTTSGGLGEAEVGGPTISVVPKSGGNTVAGQLYLSGVSKGMVGSNYSDALRTAGLSTPGKAAQAVGFHRRRWRPDQAGSHLVLRHGARRRAAPVDSRHLPESECRRSDEVGRTCPTHQAGARRRELPVVQRARHNPGDVAQQVQHSLGLADPV